VSATFTINETATQATITGGIGDTVSIYVEQVNGTGFLGSATATISTDPQTATIEQSAYGIANSLTWPLPAGRYEAFMVVGGLLLPGVFFTIASGGSQSNLTLVGEDIVTQLNAKQIASPFAVTSFTASYERKFVSDLGDDPAAAISAILPVSTDTPAVVIAPIQTHYERPAWGAVQENYHYGLVVTTRLKNADDANELDPLDLFVEQICEFLIGARKFSTTWYCIEVKPIYGDHMNEHLTEKQEYHVPIMIEMKRTVGLG
jgi:hypothetical protein